MTKSRHMPTTNLIREKPGGAYGTFLCQNVHDPNDVGVMKIIMHPYAGSEYTSSAERARQASDSLTVNGRGELEPLQTLTKNQSKSTAVIRQYQAMQQDEKGIVPDGYLHLILMNRAPGVELSRELFWSLGYEERARIRNAFRDAWMECVRAGVRPIWGHLFWDTASSKMWVPCSLLPIDIRGGTATEIALFYFLAP
ncbi:hypothetical protein BJX76DRAFT_357636 [Aspergillus varians]